MSNTAIADHALLSDRHSTALVDRSGSVEWLGFPRFDSPSVFGRLLGPDAGHWSITPVGDWTSARRSVDRTLVLETTTIAGETSPGQPRRRQASRTRTRLRCRRINREWRRPQ
jgi:GH15 family glucan-1,4-alpha-glucosidase